MMSVFPYFIRDSGIFFLEMLDYLFRLFSLELQPDLSAVFFYYQEVNQIFLKKNSSRYYILKYYGKIVMKEKRKFHYGGKV